MIYFIAQGDEYVKIGYGGDPESRLSQLQVGNPNELRIMACFSGGQQEEEILHSFWREVRVRGEWFEICDPLIDFIHILVGAKDIQEAIETLKASWVQQEADVIPFPVTSA